MHKGDLQGDMLKQWPTLDIPCSNWYHIQAQVAKIESYIIHSARVNLVLLYDLHHFVSGPEPLDFSDSLLADNQYVFL